MVLEQLDMVERRLDQRVGAWLAIFLEQVALQAAAIDADADRAAVRLGGAHHFGDALARPDIAGVDPQASRAGVRRLQRALVVKMDVGDDRHAGGADDLAERGGALDVGAAHADDVGAGVLAAADLVDRRARVAGRRVGHRLDGDRRVAADGDGADHDLAARAADDVAPGTKRHGVPIPAVSGGCQRLRRPTRGIACGR